MASKPFTARMTLVQRDSDGMWSLRDEATGDQITRYAFRSDAADALSAAGYSVALQNAIGSTWHRAPAVPSAWQMERDAIETLPADADGHVWLPMVGAPLCGRCVARQGEITRGVPCTGIREAAAFVMRADDGDVTIQSRRDLQAWVNTRGPGEALSTMVAAILGALEDGGTVRVMFGK